MIAWTYYLTGNVERADEGKAGLVRVPAGGPVTLAEALYPSGEWSADDRMFRATYQGSDYEFTEITPERAEELMHRWLEIGRITSYPSGEPSIDPETAARLVEADRQAAARWRGVPAPPGAADL